MDLTVPASAKKLLDFISLYEAPQGYDTVYGGRRSMGRMGTPLSKMRLKAILDQGKWRTRTFGSSACGRYQFMDATLRDLATKLKLQADDVFDGPYQDRLGYELLRRRGWDQWAIGKMTHDDFMIQLAKEWASFPVPYRMKGAKRTVDRGQSYYEGDALNHAGVGATEVWKFLNGLNREAEPGKTPPPSLNTEPVPDDPVASFWAVLVKAANEYFAARKKVV